MSAVGRPLPTKGPYDVPYWRHVAEGELRLQRCSSCDQFRYPPGPVCPECLAPEYTWEPLSGSGSLLAWTVFHREYFPGLPVPYIVAAVRTPEGPILVGNLVRMAEVRLSHDMPLRAVFEDVDAPDGVWRICQWTPLTQQTQAEE